MNDAFMQAQVEKMKAEGKCPSAAELIAEVHRLRGEVERLTAEAAYRAGATTALADIRAALGCGEDIAGAVRGLAEESAALKADNEWQIAQNVKMFEALQDADRRFRDIAVRKGGPAWDDAKDIMRADHELIHDGICEGMKEAGQMDLASASIEGRECGIRLTVRKEVGSGTNG